MGNPTPAHADSEMTTFSGGSTSGSTSRVLAIDLGMFYSATAEASPTGGVNQLMAGNESRALFRMAVTSEDGALIFGNRAMERRVNYPQRIVHWKS